MRGWGHESADGHGRVAEELKAATDDVVCELRQGPSIQPGDAVVILAEVVEHRESDR